MGAVNGDPTHKRDTVGTEKRDAGEAGVLNGYVPGTGSLLKVIEIT